MMCERCGAGDDYFDEPWSDGSHWWHTCCRCGWLRRIGIQEPRGHRVLAGGGREAVAECTGEFDCKPGSNEEPGSEPVWWGDAKRRLRERIGVWGSDD